MSITDHEFPMSAEWAARGPGRFPPAFASGWGDDAYGLFADLKVSTGHGTAVQRFRWIEPGRFMMGSPKDEPERDEREGPQHLVTLSHGFWLGSTACTQAFWQALMGENPSRFKGDTRPVEQVSWDGVQGFLRKLEGLVPGCVADLPTEAEWEYACRAGTTTAYSFGEELTADQATFNQTSDGTTDVGSYAANAWGLYDMHGNVWEWCSDGLRDYGASSVVDPRGPEDKKALRAIRGGSWFNEAWGARSAYRYAVLPGYAFDARGFRLCLRSIESSQGRPGGSSGLPPRDEAEPANLSRSGDSKLPKAPGSLVDHGEGFRVELFAVINQVLGRINSGESGLDPAQAKTAKRALSIIQGEITAPHY